MGKRKALMQVSHHKLSCDVQAMVYDLVGRLFMIFCSISYHNFFTWSRNVYVHLFTCHNFVS